MEELGGYSGRESGGVPAPDTGPPHRRRRRRLDGELLQLLYDHQLLQPDPRHVFTILLLLYPVRRRHLVPERASGRDWANGNGYAQGRRAHPPQSVSYTHLTLP